MCAFGQPLVPLGPSSLVWKWGDIVYIIGVMRWYRQPMQRPEHGAWHEDTPTPPWEFFLLVPAGAGIAHQAAHLLLLLPTFGLCKLVGSLAMLGSWPLITLALSSLNNSLEPGQATPPLLCAAQ